MRIALGLGGRHGQGAGFVSIVLLLLSLTLASALIPLGPPASRLVGSAFSPATMSVAIKARVAQPEVVARPALPPAPDFPLALLTLTALMLCAMVVRAALPVSRLPDRHAFRLRAWRSARGPPLFS